MKFEYTEVERERERTAKNGCFVENKQRCLKILIETKIYHYWINAGQNIADI